jgi:protein-disulfide isomerase
MPEVKKIELSPSISIIIAGVIIAGAIVFVGKFPAQANPDSAPQAQAGVPVPAPAPDDHRYGSVTAPIVLIEYSDFQCPYCSIAHPTLKRLVDESEGKVAWVYRHFPLDSIHPQARPAAEASECIAEQLGNDGFWRFADALFADQDAMSASRYTALAGELGANVLEFGSCMSSGRYKQKVEEHYGEAVAHGGRGTPYTVVYGGDEQVPVSGALPYEQFKSVITGVESRL